MELIELSLVHVRADAAEIKRTPRAQAATSFSLPSLI